jgi:lipopolysaccharide export system protein LptC
MDIVADFSLGDGTGIHVTAGSGVVDTTTRVLQMADGIHMAAQNGYQANTQSAVADLRAGTIHGEKGIDANGALGRITAQRFAMNRTTKQLRFSGDVRMIMNANSAMPKRTGKP